ncbi:MAG TPA: hypothetical protein VHC73_03360 [Vitreimonas sp.]|jgi:hypothetical protein|nr:hypothetical protein [Vitreimonas sp.]
MCAPTHPKSAFAASLYQQGQYEMKEPAMFKVYTLVGAIVLFAPFALAALAQATRIIA